MTYIITQAEQRAAEAERQVSKLQNEVDRLEGLPINHCIVHYWLTYSFLPASCFCLAHPPTMHDCSSLTRPPSANERRLRERKWPKRLRSATKVTYSARTVSLL